MALPLAALMALALLSSTDAAAAPPASGDWVVTANESYADQTIVIEGNVFVRAPGNLTLTNVTLEINSTTAARRGVVVEAGAELNTRDADGQTATSGDRTVIRPLTAGERITFVAAPGSSVDLRQTALWGVGYTQAPINASAVYLQTNATALENVTVFSSYFGIYFAGVVGQFSDLSVHNNTYDGLEVDSASNLTVRGLLAADNGGAGVHISGGRFALSGASLLANADGLAVKFGGSASASLFDSSGNSYGFLVINANLTLASGRITNSSTAGIDASQPSTVTVTGVQFADDSVGVHGSLGASFSVSGGSLLRGVHAAQLRSGSSLTFSDLLIQATNGDAVDFDSSSGDFFRCVFESVALGGSITASTGFGFLDSTLANATAGGFTFTNSTGIYLHNPLFTNNKGRAVDLVGTSNSILDATVVAEINRSVVDLRQVSVLGTLKLVDATVHAVAAVGWTVSGALDASNASILGDVAGASLTLQAGAGARVRGLTVTDFDLRFSGASPSADVDGLTCTGSGELASLSGNYTWRNLTQGPGSGRVRGALGNLTVISGSAAALRAEAGGRIDLVDVSADLAAATYAGSGAIRQFWTTAILTLWQASVPAPYQNFTLRNATGQTVAQGNTDGAGLAPLGPTLAAVGTTGGVASSNPHRLDAGASTWAATLNVSILSAGTVPIALADAAPPRLSVASPAAGASVSSNPVVVAGNVSDGESGVASLAWSLDNITFTSGGVGDPFALAVAAPLETTYLVTVRATDFAGNAAFAQVSFRVDRTAPTIALTQPANGSYLRGPTVRFIGGTEDGATLTINGTAVPLDPFGDFDANLSLPEGDVTVTVLSVDAAGNTYSVQVALHIDSTPPAIAVFSPANGSTVGGLTADLVGRVEPGASLSVDAVSQIIFSNGSFNVSVDLLAEGQNILVVRSVDRAGNANQTTWVLVRDTRAPQVTVEGLVGSSPFAIATTSPTFNITTDEYALIQATVSPGGATDNSSGLQLLFRPVLSEGAFTLRVTATDAGGNSRVWNFSLRVDVTPPTITLDNRTEVGFVNANPWRVSVGAEPGANVTVGSIRAIPTSLGGSTYEATVNLTPGLNTVVVVVTDAAGNRAIRTVNITLDQTPPVIELTTPGSDLTTNAQQIPIAGRTEPGSTVTVNGHDVPVDAAGNFVTAVNLVKGANNIVVVATDRAGNSHTAQRTVTRQSGVGTLTGNPFVDANLTAISLFIIAIIIAAAIASRAVAKRRGLGHKAAAIEREIDAARIQRNDLPSLENFSPRTVNDPEFVNAQDFRDREAQAESQAAAKEELSRPKK